MNSKEGMKGKRIYKTIPHGNNRLYFRISEIYVETMQTFTTNQGRGGYEKGIVGMDKYSCVMESGKNMERNGTEIL